MKVKEKASRKAEEFVRDVFSKDLNQKVSQKVVREVAHKVSQAIPATDEKRRAA